MHTNELRECPMGFGPERFSFPYGEHIFVLARPLAHDWKEFDGSTMNQGREEWRPMMVRGHGTGQRLFSPGSHYAQPMARFEIGPQLNISEIMDQAQVPASETPAPTR